jgi:hypothetical protein
MRRLRRRERRRFLLFSMVLVLISGGAGYALTATNTITSGGSAGDGAGVVSGYTIASVTWTLNSTNPDKIDKWSFSDASPAPGAGAGVQVYSRTENANVNTLIGGLLWVPCTHAASTWTCDPGAANEPPTNTATSVRIIAAQ